MKTDNTYPRIVDLESTQWEPHPRFPGILMKTLLTTADNAFANVNLVLIPPGCEVGWHHHSMQMETVFLLQGQSTLTIDKSEQPLHAGQIVAIPLGAEHTLRNNGTQPVEIMAIFTPPL
jgi:quercetin dioxygenase-like cupin family protein